MRFDGRHSGLLQIKEGIAIAARLCCALQSNEVRRKFHVGRGGTAPVPRRIIIAVFDLFSIQLVDVGTLPNLPVRSREISLHIQRKRLGFDPAPVFCPYCLFQTLRSSMAPPQHRPCLTPCAFPPGA